MRKTLRAACFVVLTLTAAACSSDRGTAPDPNLRFDAARVGADVEAMETILSKAAWESFTAMSPRFALNDVGAVAVSASRQMIVTPASSAADSRQLAVSAADRLLRAGSVSSAPVLPVESLGKTFVFDAVLQRYVAAPERLGAPANGVRFILYAVNPITHQPIVEVEVGHADLLDEGAARATGIGLRLLVVSEGTTFLDYAVNMDGTETAGSLSVAGFMTDGSTRLDFRIDVRGAMTREVSTLDVDFHFAIPQRAFTIEAKVRGVSVEDGSSGHVELNIRSGRSTITFHVRGDDHAVSAAIYVDGRLFATVTGDPRDPHIRGAGGRELTQEEMEVLGRLVRFAGGVFEVMDNLLKPVEGVLALSRIP